MATTKPRQDLRSKFVRNAIPTEQDFKDLIDAQLNQKDDGIFRNPGEPLSIVAGTDPQKRAIQLYGDDTGAAPDWLISLNPGQDPSNPRLNRRGFGIATADGTTRLFIDLSGNVGIGTTNPPQKLSIAGGLNIDQLDASDNTLANGLRFGQGASGEGIASKRTATGNQYGLDFYTNSANRLSIANGGNVGIGTTTPAYPLHVKTEWGILALDSNQVGQDAGLRLLEGGAVKWHLWNAAVDKKLYFAREGLSPSLTIDAEGRVGIGTNNPTQKLSIAGGLNIDQLDANDNTLANGLRFGQGASGEGIASKRTGSGNQYGLDFYTQSKTRLSITNGGAVGIGTTTPADQLDVVGRVRAGALTVGPWPANPASYAFIGSNLENQELPGNYALLVGTGAEVGATYLNGSATIGLRIGNDQHVTITGNGNVGIGTMSPDFLMDVGGRMRVRQRNNTQKTAGIWFSAYVRTGYGTSEINNAFVGLKSANEVGFSNSKEEWALWVNTDDRKLYAAVDAFKPSGGSWGQYSDIRLKKNILPLEGALESLLKLRGVSYEWKNPENQGGLVGPQAGFLAQDVEAIFPDWVGIDNEGFKTLSIRGFEALVVEALKELKAENISLLRQLTELQEQVRLHFPDLVTG
jgi:hypothetical protein